jgi:uncharacterized Zn finger protein
VSFYGWKPYVTAAERRKKAQKAAAKAKTGGATLSPVAATRGAIAKTFWGKAWCDNLEHYSDLANRLPRGRTYVRNGSVIDLKITEGEVQAQVMGSSLYKVAVSVIAVPRKRWRSVSADCAGSIDSLVELLQGRLSKAVMERICRPGTGLFPAPQEIKFNCSCPDWASMCKHVAAVLYGVGSRLDEKPELLFTLRRVDAKDLVMQAGAGLPKSKRGAPAGKVLDDVHLADVFGIEMADVAPAMKPATRRHKSKATKAAKTPVNAATTTTRKAPTAGKTEATKKMAATKKPLKTPVKAKVPAKFAASSRKSATNQAQTVATLTVPKRNAATTGYVSSRLAMKKSR